MLWEQIKEEIRVVFERDPAVRSVWEVVFAYPGFHAVWVPSVPAHTTVVGVPGRVVKGGGLHSPSGKPIVDLDHADLPDPLARVLSPLLDHIEKLEHRLEEVASRQGSLENRFAEGDEELQRVRVLLKNGTLG